MTKVLMVYMDFQDTAPDGFVVPETLHAHLTSNWLVQDWWNPMPGLYFIKTSASLSDISFELRKQCGQQKLIIAEIKPDQIDGNMPPQAWDWFQAI